VNLPARLGANLAQCLNEALAIRIIHEDQFAPVTAIHDVINRASLLDSQLAGPAGGGALAALCINIKN
jgi:DNA/RNA-binding domain of Phe-tRNA-synthetase-like protein